MPSLSFPQARLWLSLLAAAAAAPVAAQDVQQARSLAATCANCHGTHGHAQGAMKPLAGVPADRLLASLADYRSGAQPATVMHQIVKGYRDDQLQLIARYFAAQKPKP